MAEDPESKEKMYFIDLCMPFGASISCANFQAFSDALKHITDVKLGRLLLYPPHLTNYLNDFLFIAITLEWCNQAVHTFLGICNRIGCPIARTAKNKTEWGTQVIVFLGMLMDGKQLLIAVPFKKSIKALSLLNWAIQKRKVTIHFVQKLTGTLNFLSRAIVPGRVFTRSMYRKLSICDKKGNPLKQHHHMWLNRQFVMDCELWRIFLL